MMRAAGRAIAAAVLGGLAALVALSGWYGWHPALTTDFAVTLPGVVSGVYPSERVESSGLTFAWTSEVMTVRLPGLDRRVPWTLALRVRGPRPGAAANPDMTFFADGVRLLARRATPGFEEVSVTIPARPDRPRGAVLTMQVSKTFVPSRSDSRTLGVMLDRLALRPAGLVLPPRTALRGAALAAMSLGAAIALLGVTAGSAIGAVVLLAVGETAIIARGFGPYTDFPSTAAWLAGAVALALVILAAAVRTIRRVPLRHTARFAAAFSAGALFLKLLVLLHPDLPIGDALFQAHRFQEVLAGHLYFTSIAPGGYHFPYAPGLYVFASAFAALVHRGASDIALLRIVVCSADAIAGMLLYRLVACGWDDRLAGAIAVALYQLTVLGYGVELGGNLTNAFSQALAVVGLVLMGGTAVRLERPAVVAGLAAVLAAAYVSHTGTLAILFTSTLVIAWLFRRSGDPALRSPAAAILVATLAAGLFATVAYYGHFMTTYRTEFARLSQATASGADAGHRSLAVRAESVWYYLGLYFGLPLLALAVIGAWRLARRGADRLTLTIAGWLAACAAFLVLGVLTPVDMRHYLAAIPAVAVVAAFGAARGWSAGPRWRIVAAVLLAGTVWVGVRNWWVALG